MTSDISLPLVIVKSILLEPQLLWNVDLSLISFIMCNCLLAMYSSSFLPLEFVNTSYHVFDLALQSAAIKILHLLIKLIISSILCMYVCMYVCMHQFCSITTYTQKFVLKCLCNFITKLHSVTNSFSTDSYCSCCSVLTCYNNVN